jgi:hypothetical protein
MYVMQRTLNQPARRWPTGYLGQAQPAVPPLGSSRRLDWEVRHNMPAAERQRFRRAAGLLAADLQIRNQVHQFSAHNFLGDDKCNLFALDVAWRSGFRVPLVVRSANPLRLGYPATNNLAWLAQRALRNGAQELTGRDGTLWGWVDTGDTSEQINRWIADGFSEFIVGWRGSGTGHMGIVSRLDNLVRDAQGRITDIRYVGWEANAGAGAREVVAATPTGRWRTDHGNLGQCNQAAWPPGTNIFRVFRAIHIIGLVAEDDPARRHTVVDAGGWCNLNA